MRAVPLLLLLDLSHPSQLACGAGTHSQQLIFKLTRWGGGIRVEINASHGCATDMSPGLGTSFSSLLQSNCEHYVLTSFAALTIYADDRSRPSSLVPLPLSSSANGRTQTVHENISEMSVLESI